MNEKETVKQAILLGKLSFLSTLINVTTNLSVDFEISDYVDKVEIKIYNTKKLEKRKPSINEELNYISPKSNWNYSSDITRRLEEIESELVKILKDEKLDYENYYKEYKTVVSGYSFYTDYFDFER